MRERSGYRPSRGLVILVGLAVLAIVGFILTRVFSGGGEATLIKADRTPYKVKPTDSGGMEFPNQDKLVFNAAAGEGKGGATVEHLMPGPETPNLEKTPDVAAAVPPAPQAAPVEPVQSPIDALMNAGSTPAAAPAPTPVAQPVTPLAPQPVKAAEPQPAPMPAPAVAAKPTPSKLPKIEDASTVAAMGRAVAATEKKAQAAARSVDAPVAFDPDNKGGAVAAKPVAPAPAAPEEPDATPEPAAKETPKVAKPAPVAAGGARIQLASFNDRAAAQQALGKFSATNSGSLGGVKLFVAAGSANGRSVYRIQGNVASRDEASRICSRIASNGGQCVIAH